MTEATDVSAFDVQHRDCYASLEAMRDAGGVDLALFSPPYPDARKPEAYGAEFDTTFAGYQRLGDAVFQALKPGGVCALNIDGPVRVWRPELGESERSLIAFEVAIDWAKRVGFRYVEHCAYHRPGVPTDGHPRWRSGWEPIHVFSRPGAEPFFDRRAYTKPAKTAGVVSGCSRGRNGIGWSSPKPGKKTQPDRRYITTAEPIGYAGPAVSDGDHPASFARQLADAYVLCYSPPGGLVGDPFVGSGTVAFACHRHGRRFIGGDLGIRNEATVHGRKVPCGRRWADIVNDGLRQQRLFA